ncbi:hypothetical protein IG611_09675 [Pectobacterium sp. A535-S3-A17]|uniref:hypothetical protein n=1 Tax=Pectobacterium quasiaquaticum TaxID=2774015 RepID=UPI00187362B0|nr:hypothetical protein [Pectobacterium quasiaquaticum]MBE5212569.1 hypothetical protein [Pectobacterium quasiaquaticum]MBE5225625.1 hypothetical protein [Pectobacterium quasiaquaticum]
MYLGILSSIGHSNLFRFLASAVISTVILSLLFIRDYKVKDIDDKFKNLPNVLSEYDPINLTHRLVKLDEINGIVSANEASIAYGAVNEFLRKVKETCKLGDATEIFLHCANGVLGNNFYYKVANTVARAYANHYSDCDLNVYLLFDAARLFNKKIEIVYAPRHAFVSFISEKYESRFYWETTENGNKGALADLTKPLYNKTINHFYYSPMGEDLVEKVYPILSLTDIDEEKVDTLFNSIDKTMADNPLFLDFYFSNKEDKKELNKKDIYALYGEIQNDISAVDKRLILSRYLIANEKRDEAEEILNQIDDGACKLSCMKVRKEISYIDKIQFHIMKRFESKNAKLSAYDIKIFLYINLFFYFIIMLVFLVAIVIKDVNEYKHAKRNDE